MQRFFGKEIYTEKKTLLKFIILKTFRARMCDGDLQTKIKKEMQTEI